MKKILFVIAVIALAATAFAGTTPTKDTLNPASFKLVLVTYADETQQFHWCEDCRVREEKGRFQVVDIEDGHIFFDVKRVAKDDILYVDDKGYEYSVFVDPKMITIVNDDVLVQVVRTW
jgi:hypothetical protein